MDELFKAVQILEDRLAKSKYLASKNFTLADVFNYNELSTAQTFLKIDLSKYVKVTAWMDKISKDPIVKELTDAAMEAAAKLG